MPGVEVPLPLPREAVGLVDLDERRVAVGGRGEDAILDDRAQRSSASTRKTGPRPGLDADVPQGQLRRARASPTSLSKTNAGPSGPKVQSRSWSAAGPLTQRPTRPPSKWQASPRREVADFGVAARPGGSARPDVRASRGSLGPATERARLERQVGPLGPDGGQGASDSPGSTWNSIPSIDDGARPEGQEGGIGGVRDRARGPRGADDGPDVGRGADGQVASTGGRGGARRQEVGAVVDQDQRRARRLAGHRGGQVVARP